LVIIYTFTEENGVILALWLFVCPLNLSQRYDKGTSD